MATIDEGAWDGNAAMSAAAQSDDPAAAYRAICAGRREGDPELQSTWALPHHSHPGDPPNADGTRNAMARFGQTEGLINADEARAHLEAHMADIQSAAGEGMRAEIEGELQVRDIAKRELDVRLVNWDTVVETLNGPEMFVRGAFDGTDPDTVLLMGMNHEAHLGLNQNSQPTLVRRPVGKALRIDDRPDGAYATFRVAKTQAGDEILTLADERIVKGVSIEFTEVPGGTQVITRNGRRLRLQTRVRLDGASTTYRPAYPSAEVIQVRSEQEETVQVTESTEAPVAGAVPPSVNLEPLTRAIEAQSAQSAQQSEQMRSLMDRFLQVEEQTRGSFTIPSAPEDPKVPSSGIWMQSVLRMLSGERIAETQMREIADLVTTDNIGVVPPAYLTEIIGVINRRRPFLETTRRITTPSSGMRLVVPRIVSRPTVAQQVNEKDELSSTKTEIDTVDFPAVTKGGVGDISLQLLKRSDPSFLELYLSLLLEAYAAEAEVEAVESLLGLGSGGFGSGGFGNGGVNDGGTLDPSDGPSFGAAWANGYNVMFGGPDTIWLSSAAVSAFIDAKATTSNLPLYGNLNADFSAAGGVGGNISGLRPVHVPALNNTGVDILVGPSNGFAWAEDGTYTLQVDVPAKAGRDVAIVGMLWFAPLYPTAFTGWALAGS